MAVKIKRLYIGSMGIYRNALMDNISPKIVVIGGLNRAGKTTFLEVLRYMLYGFPKNLRDDKVEYHVESDLKSDDFGNLNLRINGLGEPQITSMDYNKSIASKEIFKNIDSFTYRNLYSITLDELKRCNGKEEEEKLQAVLLGSGIKDIVHLPRIIENFRKEKEKIGGKLGSPNTRMFKAYYDKILEGIENRDEALKELEEYNEKCDELDKLKKEINALDNSICKIQNEMIILEVLKANFDIYKEKSNLEIDIQSYEENYSFQEFENLPSMEKLEILYEDYKNVCSEYYEAEKRNSSFKENYIKLLERRDDILAFDKQKSGIKQKIDNYLSLKSQFDRDNNSILKKMDYLDWKEDVAEVLNIKCDFIEEDKLFLLKDGINEAEDKKKHILWEIEDINSKQAFIKKEFDDISATDLSKLIKKYLYVSTAAIFVGIILCFFNKLLGGSLAITGITVFSIYFLVKYFSQNNILMKKRNLELEIKSSENRLKARRRNLEIVENNIKDLYEQVKQYNDILKIDNEMSVNTLCQYFKEVQELKDRIINLGYAGKKMQGLYEEIKSDLLRVKDIVSLYTNRCFDEKENILNLSDEIFNIMDYIRIQLEEAEKLQSISLKKQSMEEKICRLFSIDEDTEDIIGGFEEKLNKYKIYNKYLSLKVNKEIVEKQFKEILKSDRLKKALAYFNIDNSFESINSLFLDYSSKEHIQREYDNHSDELKSLFNSLESLREKRQELKTDINNLKTSEKLQESQRMIDEARGAMESLALKYAYYAGAEYVLEKVQKKFIEKAKDSILTGASNILDKMTSGEIKTVFPSDSLLQSDYKIETKEKEIYKSVDILSRGTAEQLFLSVRINRIKELTPKLPIIIDDALVNFDSIHTRNTLKIIDELVDDHQIFILTCHPKIVETINHVDNKAQYWKLEKGRFELSDFKHLIEYLS